MARILVIGSGNTDMITQVKEIPKPGQTVLGGKFLTASGGKGANQAVAASRLGGQVTFVACLGGDSFGDQLIANYTADNIDVRHIIRDPNAPTGVALIFVDAHGENAIAVAPGANARLRPRHIQALADTIARVDIVVLQLETPLDVVEKAAHIAHREGKTVILNPAPAQTLSRDLLKNLSVITPNQTEAELLSGINPNTVDNAKLAAKALLDQGVKTVILTMGEQGTLVCNHELQTFVPSFKVEVVDTTAAGDTFNGALAVALSEQQSLMNAVRFANAAGALAVTQQGAQPSIPTRSAVDLLL